MAVPHGLRRLHKLRLAEEQQKRSALASALQELHRLEGALKLALGRATLGRRIVNASVQSGKQEDRFAGLEEIAAADRLARVLAIQIHRTEEYIAKAREDFFAKRVQRRQVETLLEVAIAESAAEEKRKSQIELDDWHRSRSNTDGSNHAGKTRASTGSTGAPGSADG